MAAMMKKLGKLLRKKKFDGEPVDELPPATIERDNRMCKSMRERKGSESTGAFQRARVFTSSYRFKKPKEGEEIDVTANINVRSWTGTLGAEALKRRSMRVRNDDAAEQKATPGFAETRRLSMCAQELLAKAEANTQEGAQNDGGSPPIVLPTDQDEELTKVELASEEEHKAFEECPDEAQPKLEGGADWEMVEADLPSFKLLSSCDGKMASNLSLGTSSTSPSADDSEAYNKLPPVEFPKSKWVLPWSYDEKKTVLRDAFLPTSRLTESELATTFGMSNEQLKDYMDKRFNAKVPVECTPARSEQETPKKRRSQIDEVIDRVQQGEAVDEEPNEDRLAELQGFPTSSRGSSRMDIKPDNGYFNKNDRRRHTMGGNQPDRERLPRGNFERNSQNYASQTNNKRRRNRGGKKNKNKNKENDEIPNAKGEWVTRPMTPVEKHIFEAGKKSMRDAEKQQLSPKTPEPKLGSENCKTPRRDRVPYTPRTFQQISAPPN
ncbi:unnamed protein product, partial [Mesorhabditis spiculigera]